MNQEPKRDLHDPKVDHDHVHERNYGGGGGRPNTSYQSDYEAPMSPTQLAWRVGLVIAGFILGLIVGNIS